MINYEEKKILIWGKTYPELSSKYFETVCTGGVLENGSPVRLYPIPFRYLSGEDRFEKYQWVTARLLRNPSDARPESYRVQPDSLQCGEKIPTTKDEWGKRAEILFKNSNWQFNNVDDLLVSQRQHKTSLGVITPKEIVNVEVTKRSKDDEKDFAEKFEQLKLNNELSQAQLDLFEQSTPAEMKHLDFVSSRIRIKWLCASTTCNGHQMQILDWEVGELQRKQGDDAACEKVKAICDLKQYALKFFLGNLAQHPTAFTIVGLWYPKRQPDRLFY